MYKMLNSHLQPKFVDKTYLLFYFLQFNVIFIQNFLKFKINTIELNFINIFSNYCFLRKNDEKLTIITDQSDYSDFDSESSCDSKTHISVKLHKKIRFL